MMCGFSCVKKAACILSYFLISIIQHLKESHLFLKILHLHSVVQSSYKLLLAHQVMYLILTQAETGWTLDTHQCPSRRSEIIVPLFSELLWTITGKPEHSIASGPKRFVGQSKSNTAQEGHSPLNICLSIANIKRCQKAAQDHRYYIFWCKTWPGGKKKYLCNNIGFRLSLLFKIFIIASSWMPAFCLQCRKYFLKL